MNNLANNLSDISACYEKLEFAIRGADHPLPPDPDLFQSTSVMALFMLDSAPSLLFIQKADREGYPWANQMAFPGGHVDENDENPRATALRELDEEMGIASENVRVIGSLGHFQTLNNKDIEAFTGVWNQKDDIRFDTYEIQRVFRIPFAHLARVHQEKGYAGCTPSIMELTYPYDDVTIWGVTAKIVHHLIEVVTPT